MYEEVDTWRQHSQFITLYIPLDLVSMVTAGWYDHIIPTPGYRGAIWSYHPSCLCGLHFVVHCQCHRKCSHMDECLTKLFRIHWSVVNQQKVECVVQFAALRMSLTTTPVDSPLMWQLLEWSVQKRCRCLLWQIL